jgi:hypothetical protein
MFPVFDFDSLTQPMEMYKSGQSGQQCVITTTGGDIAIGTTDTSKEVEFNWPSGSGKSAATDFSLSFKVQDDVYIADDTTNPDNAGVMERMYNLHHTLGDVGPFQSNTTSKWSDLLAAHQTTLNTVTGAMDTCHASIYALEARIDKLKAALDKIVGPIPVGTACTNGVTYTPPVSSNDLVGTFACLA